MNLSKSLLKSLWNYIIGFIFKQRKIGISGGEINIMDIIRVLLPVILISVLAIFTITIAKKKTKNHKSDERQEENYMSEGMAVGMCLGTAAGIALDIGNIAIGMSIGML